MVVDNIKNRRSWVLEKKKKYYYEFMNDNNIIYGGAYMRYR